MKIYINSNFGRYFVKNLNKLNFEKNENYYYLIDKNVYKKILKKKISGKIFVLNTSEKIKSYHEVGHIIKQLTKLNIRKDSTIVAIGGGIVQDVAGFISSILFRGVKWT